MRSEVPATVNRQRATNPSELLASATNWNRKNKLNLLNYKSVLGPHKINMIRTSKTRLRRYFPARESRPSPPKAFKLSCASIGQILSSTRFCIKPEREKERVQTCKGSINEIVCEKQKYNRKKVKWKYKKIKYYQGIWL